MRRRTLPPLLVLALLTAGCSVEPDASSITGPGAPLEHAEPPPSGAPQVFEAISAGGAHTCALTSAGDAHCWGLGEHGQLGDGREGLNYISTTPVAVRTEHAFTSLVSGGRYSCGLTVEGDVYCWGDDPVSLEVWGPVPVLVSEGRAFTSLTASWLHTCALDDEGRAYCWGRNGFFYSVLGDGSTTDTSVPVPVVGDWVFASLSAGGRHTCGLDRDGAAYCWGSNDFYGQLGNGTTTSTSNPEPVVGGHEFEALGLGQNHTCAIDTDGRAFCWGSNEDGALGDGTTEARYVPTRVRGDHSFVAIEAGSGWTCALETDGTVYCWGREGEGDEVSARLEPTPMGDGLTFASISAGILHACALAPDGGAYCWGENDLGQLGDGTTTYRLEPSPVQASPARSGDAPSEPVTDLTIESATASSLTLNWTQVDDGRGVPAWYRVRYGSPLTDWKAGAIGCDRTLMGTEIGARMSCTIEGLDPGQTYDLQLYSYHFRNGKWAGAHPSNRVSGSTRGS